MDRNGSRSIQSAPKAIATDSRKNQDGAAGRSWAKGGRRREPSGGTFRPKNDASRKPTPQRNRAMDKRPAPRGSYYYDIQGRNESTRVDDYPAELGSVFIQGSKKRNCNELVTNFIYGTRGEQASALKRYGNTKFSRHVKKHIFKKEEHIQATCQFVIKPSSNYKQYTSNPDMLVDWNLVEQVNYPYFDSLYCPICLDPPVAAKMTKCCHVFCWPCILHFFADPDVTRFRCPCCGIEIQKKELKSANGIYHPLLTVNDSITFKLMKRLRDSLIVYPAGVTDIDESKDIFYMSDERASDIYCKLLVADHVNVLDIIKRERSQLGDLCSDDENATEVPYILEALELLEQREKDLRKDMDNHENKTLNSQSPFEHRSLNKSFASGANRSRFESSSSDDSNDIASGGHNDVDLLSNSPPKSSRKYFYFYQVSDGQYIYLHPVNARMLEDTYGSLEFAPHTIEGKILEMESADVTTDYRNRKRYMQHVPVTAHVEFAEIQMKSPLVTNCTMRRYQEQLEERKRNRNRKVREEKRLEQRVIAEENKLLGRIPQPQLRLTSTEDFPEFSDAMQRIAEAELATSPTTSALSDTFTDIAAKSPENQYVGPSFAKMLSSAKKQPKSAWPGLKTDNAIPPEVRLINVTGAMPTSSYRIRTRKDSDSDPESADYVQAPRSSAMLSDALAAALEKASINKGGSDGAQSGKKKKKPKQKILFTTSHSFN